MKHMHEFIKNGIYLLHDYETSEVRLEDIPGTTFFSIKGEPNTDGIVWNPELGGIKI